MRFQLLDGPDGMTIGESTGKVVWLEPILGQYWVVVGVNDGRLRASQLFDLTVLENLAPVITSSPKTSVTLGQVYSYDVVSSDANGTPITYEVAGPQGLEIDELGRLRWIPEEGDIGTHSITVTVSDRVLSTPQSFDVQVSRDTTAPTVKVDLFGVSITDTGAQIADLGDEITFQVLGSDEVGVQYLQLYLDDTLLPLDGNGITTFSVQKLGTITVRGVASDGAGNESEVVQTLTVLDFDDVDAPTVTWDELPEVVTDRVQILGTITDDNFAYYTLEVAPLGGEYGEIARGEEEVVGGVLGVFDATVLQNGSYSVRLTGVDLNGNTRTLENEVLVEGDLKLGNFTLSFTDLSISVPGIPITVTRTYDSLNANNRDDFGYGWRLEFVDTDLRTSLGVDETYEQLGIRSIGFQPGDKVYVTLPGGERETFTFNVRRDFLGFGHPIFEGEPGSESSLMVKDAYLIGDANGRLINLNGYVYYPTDYTLTTQSGIVYQINGNTGDLRSVRDTNDNILTFTHRGIESDTGVKVLFERDPQSRVVAVVDPAGNRVGYEYDAQGDLVAVTDREGNVTQFEYSDSRAHFLEEIIDPLGRSGVRSEYDDSGRLKRLLDVNGEAVELVYDPDNSTQTVKDVFGNPTTYVYDTRGNVLTEVDALSGVTKYTYDDQDNVLTETNPLGETTSYTYDSRGNVLTETDPLGNVIRYTYNSFGKILTETNPLGQTKTYTYDSKGNRLTITNAEGQITGLPRDEAGKITAVIDGEGQTTSFEYDELNRVNRQMDALGNITTYTYDSNNNRLTENQIITTSEGSQTLTQSWTYDRDNRVTSETDILGNVVRYQYDASGNLIAIIEEALNNRRTSYKYNEKGQLIETLYSDGTSEKSVYDAAGREIATTDINGETTHFVYDALGRVRETIYPDSTPEDLTDNPRTKVEYDKTGRTTAGIDPRGNRTSYQYDKAGNLISVKDALGNITTSTYNAAGRKLTETNARNHTTQFRYDDIGRLIQTILPDGTDTTTTYNKANYRTAATDRAGHTTHFVYDDLNRLVEVIYPDSTPENLTDNPRIKTEYDQQSRVIAEIDERGNRPSYSYDLIGRQTLVRDALDNTTTFTYDQEGNLLTETDANSQTTRFVYRESDNIIETHFPDGTQITTTYDTRGNVIAETDQSGKTTQYSYDSEERLTAVIDSRGQRTEYSYDRGGNLIQIKDANNHLTRYEYDALNRRTATILPLGQRDLITYDEVGNIASTTSFNGDTITYNYDSLNQLISKSYPDDTEIKYTYSAGGQISTVTDSRGITTYNYNERGGLTARRDPDGKFIRYNYDLAGNITAVITPSGTTTSTYDALNRLKTVTDFNSGITQYTYDEVGNLIKTELPNNTVQTRSYNSLNRLTFLKDAKINPDTGAEVEIIASYTYTLDSVGNPIAVQEHDGDLIQYQYDDLYRLTQEKVTTAGTVRTTNYTYDGVGNRLTRNDSSEGLTTYTYNDNDWLLREESNGEVVTYSYDQNGNTVARIKDATDKTSYSWNYENRLIAASVTNEHGTVQTQYQYNDNGIRVGEIVDEEEKRYLIDDNRAYAQVIEEYSGDGTVLVAYTHGNDLISQLRSGVQLFYHVDGLGSTRALTDSSGKVTDSYNYDAYGQLIESTGTTRNNYLYTGEQYDPNLGDYYLRARYYNPSLGRFTSRDFFEGFLTEPLSLAKYPYVHGNPVNNIDPSGLLSLSLSTSLSGFNILIGISSRINFALSAVALATAGLLGGSSPLEGERDSPTTAEVDLSTAIALPIGLALSQVQVRACAVTGDKNCDAGGLPILFHGTIFRGQSLQETGKHVRDAIFGRQLILQQDRKTKVSTITEVATIPKPVILSTWAGSAPLGHGQRSGNKAWYNRRRREGCNGNNLAAYKDLIDRTAVRGDLTCDEYPFYSTEQGGEANYERGLVSIRFVPESEATPQGILIDPENLPKLAGVQRGHPVLKWFAVVPIVGESFWKSRDGRIIT